MAIFLFGKLTAADVPLTVDISSDITRLIVEKYPADAHEHILLALAGVIGTFIGITAKDKKQGADYTAEVMHVIIQMAAEALDDPDRPTIFGRPSRSTGEQEDN